MNRSLHQPFSAGEIACCLTFFGALKTTTSGFISRSEPPCIKKLGVLAETRQLVVRTGACDGAKINGFSWHCNSCVLVSLLGPSAVLQHFEGRPVVFHVFLDWNLGWSMDHARRSLLFLSLV
ncbi:unnamed protein product [Cladocopium goreaui]|uniref:Uncharacterized protein n=1 Tax=Cladocopium goreaui TaxID=2562237 RepID=A0A9P1CNQ3_9DINO|nr:unnamed protein product [Cladocopium goreaui]